MKDLFKAIGKFFKAIGRAFKAAFKAIVNSPIARSILQIVACANPAAAVTCAATAGALTLAAGGNIAEAIVSAALSFAQVVPGGIWDTVGNIVAALPQAAQTAGTVLTHAVVSGALAVAQGGEFVHGLISGAVGAVGSTLGAAFGPQSIERVAVAAIAGGTASALVGGKFANGAVTAAFAVMYNDQMHGDGKDGAGGVAGSKGTQSGATAFGTVYSYGAGGAIKVFTVVGGFGFGFNAGLAMPENAWAIGSYQLWGSLELGFSAGLGAYLGAGAQGQRSTTEGPLPAGSATPYIGLDGAVGNYSAGVQKPIEIGQGGPVILDSGSSIGGTIRGRYGMGMGLYGAGTAGISARGATPRPRDIGDAITNWTK